MTSETTAVRHVLFGRKRRLDRLGILTFLRTIARDRAGMLELRRLCADELRRSSIHNLRDDVVIEMLADRYANGLLDLVEMHMPQAEPPGFDVEGAGDAPMQGPTNKAVEPKPSPIVPPEYPVLAGVESDQVMASTTRLVAKLAELMFGMFGFDKRISTIAETYVSVSEEEGINIGRAHNALSTTIGIELHAAGPTSLPEAAVPDAYVKAAEQAASGAPRSAQLMSDLLGPLVSYDTSFVGKAEERDLSPKAEEGEEAEKKAIIGFELELTSGLPAKNVKLEVVLGDGTVKPLKTDDKGFAYLEDLPKGSSVTLRSPWKNQTSADTFAFVELTSKRASSASIGPSDEKALRPKGLGEALLAEAKATPSGEATIATIERHKVKSGETLATVAQSVGLSEKDLARFNFGTDNPDEVSRALRQVLGCKKKSPDGKSYVFDDADEPGILLLPKPWEATSLSVDASHIVVLRPAGAPETKRSKWVFSM